MLVVGRDGAWEVVQTPLAQHASVPDAVLVDHGVLGGQRWLELRVAYVDAYQGDMTDGRFEWLGLASLAFPASALAPPADLAALFAGEAGYPWVYVPPVIDGYDGRPVDPNLEVFADEDGALTWALIAVDVAGEDDAGAPLPGPILAATSADGVNFGEPTTFFDNVKMAYSGTDPDPFPLDWAGDYPAALPVALAPWAGARWGLHLSGPTLGLFVGGADDWTPVGEVGGEAFVSTTSVVDGERLVYATAYADDPEDPTPPSVVVRFRFDEAGAYSEPEVVLDRDIDPLLRRGVGSPTLIPLPEPAGGAALLVVQSAISSSRELERRARHP